MPLPAHLFELIMELTQTEPPHGAPPLILEDVLHVYALKLVEILMFVWTRIWDPSVENNIGDPTMCFLALASIKSDGGWATAAEVTPVIARLVFCMRAVFLFDLYSDDPTAECVRGRHTELEKWHYEGTYSTFSSLCTLQHIASVIAYATPSLPAFIWFDADKTEFIWRGSLITLAAFRNFGRELMRRVYEGFQKVMFGSNLQIPGYIADDLTNTTPGYGFMTDSRNEKIVNRRAMYDMIMADPVLRQQFVIGVGPNGIPLLNLGRLRQWLIDYSDVLLVYMAAIDVQAGSPSRGTELTCIQLRNTACRTCGLYVIGRRLAIVVQYSKTSSIKGRDTLIPHVLDAFCQEYAKTVAFRLHPFAEQAVQILFPGQTALLSLWRTNLFVKFDRLYTTEELSRVLRVASLKTMDVGIGIRDYRQMSVCVRRAHCPRLDELMMFNDEEDAAALQSGHSKATEDRLYGVSAGYLGQLPENMVEPFAMASAEWQRVMGVPEGGKVVNLDDFPVHDAWKRYLTPKQTVHTCYRCRQQTHTMLVDETNHLGNSSKPSAVWSLSDHVFAVLPAPKRMVEGVTGGQSHRSSSAICSSISISSVSGTCDVMPHPNGTQLVENCHDDDVERSQLQTEVTLILSHSSYC